MSINRKKASEIDDRYISREEMKEFISNNLDTASLFTVRVMYEFFKCVVEDEKKNLK